MTIRQQRREAAIRRMAEVVIAEGLAAATLKRLGEAAGASDRMLLYYFASKDDLLAATLDHIAATLTQALDTAMPLGAPMQDGALLETVVRLLADAKFKAFMPLWFELTAGAARGQEPYQRIAGRIADGFLTWIAERLAGTSADRTRRAAYLLATVEGVMLLEGVGRPQAAALAVQRASSSMAGPQS